MGSGLILLLIVGAWLAVLVPMALRSADSGSSVDRFNDAMRVLSRRQPAGREAVGRAAEGADDASPEITGSRVKRPSADGRLEPLDADDDRPSPLRAGLDRLRTRGSVRVSRPAGRRGSVQAGPRGSAGPGSGSAAARGPRGSATSHGSRGSAAGRRRRLLVGLLVLAVGSLVAGLVGPAVLLGVHVVVDVLLVLLVLHLRRQAVVQARVRRTAVRRRRPDVPVARPVRPRRPTAGSVRVTAGSLPAAASTDPAVEQSTAVRYEDPLPAPRPAPAPAAALGGAWQPVPVPVPTYVTAPVVARRVVDLTRPGAWSDAERRAETERQADGADVGAELDHVLDRRRAAGEW